MKILTILILAIMALGCGYAQDASNTVFNESKASTILKRYEHFKDLAAAIDKKRADIQVYEAEIQRKPKSAKQEDYQEQRRIELLGLIANYNELVRQYNADMAKDNYSFTNAGNLPKSNMTPLPREFQSYILKINE